jgi:HEAT repeat protein
MGPECVPWLLRQLRAEDSWLKVKFLKLAAKQSMLRLKFEPASKTRLRAIRAANVLGPEARAAIPLLQAQFGRDDFNAYSAAFALRSMGTEALLPLMQAVTNGSRQAQLGAIINLGIMRKDAAPAIPLLIRASHDPDGEIRFCATTSLGLIGTHLDQIIPALIERLGDEWPTTRQNSLEALVWHRDQARAAVPAILKALNDPDPITRDKATNVLRIIDRKAAAEAGIK